MNKTKDESNDQKYFTVTPRLVWALSRDTYDYTLWCVIKDVAGDTGECYISTEDLAVLSMMSTGKAHQSRKHLLKCGLLKGELRRDPGYPQPVWHLSVPDLWKRNLKWCENHLKVSKRLQFKQEIKEKKKSIHPVNDKKEPSSHEKGVSPDEAKNNQEEKPVLTMIGSTKILQKELQDIIILYEQSTARLLDKSLRDKFLDEARIWEEHTNNLVEEHPSRLLDGNTVLWYAIDKCVEYKGFFEWPYTRGILNNWTKKGFMAPKPSRRSHNGKQPQTEWDEDEMEATRQSARERIKLAKEK